MIHRSTLDNRSFAGSSLFVHDFLLFPGEKRMANGEWRKHA
jgi:hypothetical protein